MPADPRSLVFADVAIQGEFIGDVSAGDRSPVWLTFRYGDGHEKAGAVMAACYLYAAEIPELMSFLGFLLDDFFEARRHAGYRDRYSGAAWPLGEATWVRNGSPRAVGDPDPDRLPRLVERMRVWSDALAAMSAEMAEVATADGGRLSVVEPAGAGVQPQGCDADDGAPEAAGPFDSPAADQAAALGAEGAPGR